MRSKLISAFFIAAIFMANTNLWARTASQDKKIALPLRLMTANEVLCEVSRQTGIQYAYPTGVLRRQINAAVFNGSAAMSELVALLAPHTDLSGNVLLLENDFDNVQFETLCANLRESDAATRRLAAYELGNSRVVRAIEPLIATLEDEDESVRHHALRSLDRLERDFIDYTPAGRVSIFELKNNYAASFAKIISYTPNATCNEWIWSAGLVGKCKRASGDTLRLLGRAKINPYEGTRKIALWSIARLTESDKDIRAIPYPETHFATSREIDGIIRKFKKERNVAKQSELLLESGRYGSEPAWELLMEQTASSIPEIRRAAIRGLARSPDPRAVDCLMKILTAPEAEQDAVEKSPLFASMTASTEYRNLAAMSLGMIGSEKMITAVEQYLYSTAKPISATTLALSWSESELAKKPLLYALAIKDTDKHGETHRVLRTYAYSGLSRLGSAACVAGIASKYDEYDNVARFAGYAAMRLAGKSQPAVDYAIEQLRKGKGQIFAHVLETAEDPRATDVLIDILADTDRKPALFAIQALGRIGDPRAVPTLLALLDNKEQWVSYEALRALRWRWYWRREDVATAIRKHPVFKSFNNPPSLKDQPENTWVCRQWPLDFDDYRAVNTSYEAGLIMDESTGMMVKSNAHGQRCDTPQMSETWLYDPQANVWRESKAPYTPFGMCGTWGITYDRSNRKVLVMQSEGGHHGWQWEKARALRSSTIWVYNGQAEKWTSMQPLYRLDGPGLRGFLPLVYMDKPGLMFLHGGEWGGNNRKEDSGRSWTYDVYANTWQMLPVSENAPGNLTHHGMCYLQKQNKVLLAPNKKGGKTWLFDPETAKWSMSDAQGDPPELGLPLVYDPVSGTALAFIAKNSGTIIWQYDPEKNLWQKIDSPVDLSPHHTSMDVCYDPKNNVFIMDGGLVTWLTDHIAVREIWTYRFKNRPAETENVYEAPLMAHDKPGYPQNVIVSVKANGTVQLDWDPVNGQDIQGYHVYAATVKTGDRLHHKQTFAGKCDDFCLTDRPIKNCRFIDKNKLSSDEGGLFKHEIRAYYVKAVNSDGIESGPSATVLSLPGIVQSVKVEQRTDGSNHISWQPSPEADLRGYAVYRMDEIMPSLPFRLNPTPIKGCEYIDWSEAPKAERQRYYVVALDALDEEGLPSNGAWAFGRP